MPVVRTTERVPRHTCKRTGRATVNLQNGDRPEGYPPVQGLCWVTVTRSSGPDPGFHLPQMNRAGASRPREMEQSIPLRFKEGSRGFPENIRSTCGVRTVNLIRRQAIYNFYSSNIATLGIEKAEKNEVYLVGYAYRHAICVRLDT